MSKPQDLEAALARAQIKVQLLKGQVEWAQDEMEIQRRWFDTVLAREHHLTERCTYLYTLAMTLGATPEQLQGKVEL